MKHQKGLRQQRRRRRRTRSMPARVLSGTAVLAAAWSLPQRCCHALRASVSSMAVSGGAGYHYRSYVGTAAQRASRTTASLAGGFVPGGAGRRKVAAAVSGSISSGFGGGGQRATRGAAPPGGISSTTARMVSGGGSDESVFFTDPDAPVEVDGVGPPGPLVGGDQVRAAACSPWLRASESLVPCCQAAVQTEPNRLSLVPRERVKLPRPLPCCASV